jgi:hypothetical protein
MCHLVAEVDCGIQSFCPTLMGAESTSSLSIRLQLVLFVGAFKVREPRPGIDLINYKLLRPNWLNPWVYCEVDILVLRNFSQRVPSLDIHRLSRLSRW